MSVKISSFEIENVKRVKAVAYEPTQNGLTVIGGRNGQGKTSVLDAIAWALGGDRFAPSAPYREGSTLPPHLKVLNKFIESFALNLPKFMNASNKEKADTLLRVIGVGDKLYELEDKEARLYNERHAVGRIKDQKLKFAKEMPDYADAPKELVSAADLIKQQQEILARNGENERKRQNLKTIEARYAAAEQELRRAEEAYQKLKADLTIARQSAENLVDESTAELERSIAEVEEINRKVRANLDKDKAESDAAMFSEQYDALSRDIEGVRAEKYNLLNSAELPLEGLSVENRELTYKGYKWDSMSGSEQLRVAAAIIRKLNPECGFVLLDKLEQMDADTLREFSAWLENEGLQAIATRVSNGDECSIIIEDGYAAATQPKPPLTKKQWEAGVF